MAMVEDKGEKDMHKTRWANIDLPPHLKKHELHYYGSKINTRRRSSNYSSRSSNEKNERRSEIDDFKYLYICIS